MQKKSLLLVTHLLTNSGPTWCVRALKMHLSWMIQRCDLKRWLWDVSATFVAIWGTLWGCNALSSTKQQRGMMAVNPVPPVGSVDCWRKSPSLPSSSHLILNVMCGKIYLLTTDLPVLEVQNLSLLLFSQYFMSLVSFHVLLHFRFPLQDIFNPNLMIMNVRRITVHIAVEKLKDKPSII